MIVDRDIPTIAEAASQIKAGLLSPTFLVESCLHRIEKHEPVINAFHTVFADQAIIDAQLAEKEIKEVKHIISPTFITFILNLNIYY